MNVPIELFLFLPAVAVLGIATSYTDMKYGKIRNKHLIAALVFIPVAYVVVAVHFFMNGMIVDAPYFIELAVNMSIALLFGFAAWHFGLWSAADGKLFFVYSGIVPLAVYSSLFLPIFPSVIILVNTFIPAFVFYAVKSVTLLRRSDTIKNLRKGVNPRIMSTLLISSLWSGWISTIIYRLIGIDLGLMGGLIVSMLVMFMINQTSRRLKVSVAMIALRIIFDGAQMLTMQFVFEFAALVAMSVPTFIIFFIASSSFSSDVKVSDLRAGMTVYDMINRYKGMYLRIKHTANAQTQSARGESYIKSGSRLEDSDIYALKNLKRRGKLKFERIGVSDTAPFAPFMFAGAVLTIATGGNLFGYLGGFLAFLLKLMGF